MIELTNEEGAALDEARGKEATRLYNLQYVANTYFQTSLKPTLQDLTHAESWQSLWWCYYQCSVHLGMIKSMLLKHIERVRGASDGYFSPS